MNFRSSLPALALIIATAFAPFSLSAAAPLKSTKRITILALGDSLTEGFGLPRKEAYPALIADKLRDAKYRFEVINAGATGGTTAGALRRLPTLLNKNKVDVLILALGINDAFHGVPVTEIRTNLQAIIDQTRAKNPGIAVIIAGMQLPFGSSGYLQAFGEMFGKLAEENHASLIPYLLEGVGGNPDLNQADFIHPNAAGQRVIAETVWWVLQPIVQRISRS